MEPELTQPEDLYPNKLFNQVRQETDVFDLMGRNAPVPFEIGLIEPTLA